VTSFAGEPPLARRPSRQSSAPRRGFEAALHRYIFMYITYPWCRPHAQSSASLDSL